jgi:cytochrome b involved in lipid metabolism
VLHALILNHSLVVNPPTTPSHSSSISKLHCALVSFYSRFSLSHIRGSALLPTTLFSFAFHLNMSRSRILSRRQIEGFIADSQLIIIFEQKVLRLDKWVERHPGGKLPILHMVGRDATDEIQM